jgi:hypothetical protein
MKIIGIRKFLKLLSRYSIDYVFHGHIHINDDYYYKATRFFNGGASLEYDVHKSTMLNLVSISDKASDFEIVRLEEDEINVENIDYIDQLIPSFAS